MEDYSTYNLTQYLKEVCSSLQICLPNSLNRIFIFVVAIYFTLFASKVPWYQQLKVGDALKHWTLLGYGGNGKKWHNCMVVKYDGHECVLHFLGKTAQYDKVLYDLTHAATVFLVERVATIIDKNTQLPLMLVGN